MTQKTQKTELDLDARLRQVQNYVNMYFHVLAPDGDNLLVDPRVAGRIEGIKAAQDDEHWDAACDLAEDLLAFYSFHVRRRIQKYG